MLCIVLASLIVAACGESAPASTPTVAPATRTPTPTATPSRTLLTSGVDSAADLDVSDPALIGPMIDRFGGGEVPEERVELADVTGDGVDEAVVIVESGGTLGDLGAAVVQVDQGDAYLLGYVEGPGRVEVRFGDQVAAVVAVTEGIYDPGEPACCPSELRERVYQWDGQALEVVIDQVIDNPSR